MLNHVTLIGNLGKDPILRETKAGTPVANFSLATSRRWKGKDGLRQEATEWHRIVCFGRTAEIASQYLTQGSRACVQGRIESDEWVSQEGEKRKAVNIVAHYLVLLGDSGGRREADPHSASVQRDRHGSPVRQQPAAQAPSGGGFDAASYDDEIPF